MTWIPDPFTGGVAWADRPSTASALSAANLNQEENAEAAYAVHLAQSVVNRYEPRTVISVMDPDYGAKGDGATDDAPAIQAALNAANAGAGGGMVFFPKTSAYYNVKSAIITYPHVRHVGEQPRPDGSVASRIKADPTGTFTNGNYTGAAIFKDVAASSDSWHGGSFELLGIDCNNIPGLVPIHQWGPGESSLIERVSVQNTAATPRTVADAVTNATTTLTSATAAFTAEDVNAVVTGTNIPATTKIDIVNSATSVTLSNAATGSGSGGSLTINRPTDGVVFDGGAPTGLMRSLQGSNVSGALLRLKNMASGSWLIESLSGDNNGGGLLRISHGAAAADPTSVTVVNFKAETYTPGDITKNDPLFLLDNCDMVALNIIGGSAINAFGGRDVVRIDQPVTARGGPSVGLVGVEGANPFNTSYTNIIRDTSTGQLVGTQQFASPQHFYPNILWGRSLVMGGGATIFRPKATAAYSASITPDAMAAPWQTITVTNATLFTINAPANPPTANQNGELTIEVFNNSGGAMGAITWNAAFVFPTGAWANPASTKRRFARFEWNGANWICTSVSSADY